MTQTPAEAAAANYRAVRDENGTGARRYRIEIDGEVAGWIVVWYKSDAVNKTGIRMFSARPIGPSIARHECETFSSAVAYIRNYNAA